MQEVDLNKTDIAASLFEQSLTPMFIFDRDTLKIVKVNNAAIQQYDYSREEFIGLHISELSVGRKSGFPTPNEDADSTVKENGVQHQTKNGQTFNAQIQMHPFVLDGQAMQLAVVYTTSSEIEKHKRTLKNREPKAQVLPDQIIKHLPGIFLLMDEEGNIIRFNKQFENITGFSEKEIIGNYALDFFAADEESKLANTLQKVITEGQASTEGTLISSEGEKIPHKLTGIKVAGNGQYYVAGIGIDISKQVAYQVKLEQSRQRMQDAQKLASIGSWEWNLQSDERSWSEQAYRNLGYEVGEVAPTQENYFNRIHPDDRPKVTTHIDKIFSNKDVNPEIEYRVIPPHGEIVKYLRERVKATRNKEGEILKLQGTVQDITRQKKIEQQLRQRSEAIASSMDGIAILNSEDELIYMNESHASIYGYDNPDELLGKTWRVLYKEEDVPYFSEHVVPKIEQTGKWRGEARGKRKDGSTFPQEISLSNIQGGGMVCVVRDITQRKKKEEQIQQALKEKEVLLKEIHHRVKNNLAIISGLLDLQKFQPEESIEKIIEDTQSRIQSIATIHEKLYETDTLADIDIKEYLEDFSNFILTSFGSNQKDITILQELEHLTLDITKAVPLGLIFNELLNNAFEHGFRELNEGKIRINLELNGTEAILSVADNGHPLPNDFSFDNSDSLGMTLVKTLTKQLEGEITFTQNGWTTFTITFPISKSDH